MFVRERLKRAMLLHAMTMMLEGFALWQVLRRLRIKSARVWEN